MRDLAAMTMMCARLDVKARCPARDLDAEARCRLDVKARCLDATDHEASSTLSQKARRQSSTLGSTQARRWLDSSTPGLDSSMPGL